MILVPFGSALGVPRERFWVDLSVVGGMFGQVIVTYQGFSTQPQPQYLPRGSFRDTKIGRELHPQICEDKLYEIVIAFWPGPIFFFCPGREA